MTEEISNKAVTTTEEHVNRWCALPIPYPEPRVVRPNPYYAMLLLEDYAGAVSEMTAITKRQVLLYKKHEPPFSREFVFYL